MKTASATPPGETTERPDAALRQTEEQLEFTLHAGRMGSWELDLATRRFTTSEYCRVVFGLGPDDPFETVEDLTALIVPEDRQKRQDAIARAIADHTEIGRASCRKECRSRWSPYP